ncbi:growth hormone-inducible transmembrane protein-like [Oppia nitens]|uniref:growth hormone-inducible transmembrane protein-like n=1 Tax=Oppia nitens TaxID=1686743 RepID=UPI0023DB6D7D|nr:growth hormone-inducible transmembrane protein-like [Oppia nitens]
MLSILRTPAGVLCSGGGGQRSPSAAVSAIHVVKQFVVKTTTSQSQQQMLSIRLIGNTAKGRVNAQTLRRMDTTAKRQTLKERLMAPTTGLPFNLGQGMIGGGALLGIGALCYYGLGLSNAPGIYERSMAWEQHVRERIHTTYAYFGSGLGLTAAAAAAALRSPAVMRMMTRNSLMSLLLTMGAMIGTGVVAQSIPYREGFGAKQLAWAAHCGVVGAVIAPLCLMGGPLIMKAAVLTAGIVGGLSAVAVCAPSDRFLNMGGPLAIGLGVVFASSLGSMFLPPTTALGASLFSLSVYGGLLLFSAFLLYDTQRIVRKAETHPVYTDRPFDPINASISIYLDVINIFIRLVTILGMGGAGKRR